jgi:hypothetical protein
VAAPIALSISPSSNLGNQQIVTVGWTGFAPTKPDPRSFEDQDEVGIYECVQTPPDGHFYYSRDCYTAFPPNAPPYPAAGNSVDPTLGVVDLNGVTGSNGAGQNGFQILEGTLHTDSRFGRPAFNVQCDQTHACVLKVVDFGTYFRTNTIPNAVGDTTPGNWTSFVDAAPSIAIPFAPLPACPASSGTAAQLQVQGAPSSSYAIEAWGAQLCNARNPIILDYAQTGEVVARGALADGATEVALASLPPTSFPSGKSYAAAPVDVSGVAIAFRIADRLSGVPITTVRLTPRLVAMLVTDSAVDGDAYADAAQLYPLTADPEFVALNPGFNFPGDPGGGLGVVEPILEGSAADDTYILTEWIAADADARAFLAGHDACGAQLNPDWAGSTYPTSLLQDLEHDPNNPAWSGYYNPITNLGTEVSDLFYGKPAGFNPVDQTGTAASMPPILDTQDSLFAEFDVTSAIRSAAGTASLSAASAQSTISNYVDGAGSGHCTPKTVTDFSAFTAPSASSMAVGLSNMSATQNGTLAPPISTSVQGAYPLTKVDYAFVPASNLTQAQADTLSAFINYVGGPGQAPTVLPYGYTPLPANLQAEDAAAAAKVEHGVSKPPTTPPTTTKTNQPAGSVAPGAGSGTPSSPVATGGTSTGGAGSSSANSGAGSASAQGSSLLHTNPAAGGSAPRVTGSLGSASSQPQSIQAPVTIASVLRTAGWLLPVALALMALVGLAGLLLTFGIPHRPKAGRP